MAGLSAATQQLLRAPLLVGEVILAAQTAAIGSTTIVTPPAGLYRMTYSLIVTSTGTSTLTANAIYTDNAKAETVAVLSAVAVTATGQFNSSILIENSATQAINYSVTLGGSGATWNLYILVERLF